MPFVRLRRPEGLLVRQPEKKEEIEGIVVLVYVDILAGPF